MFLRFALCIGVAAAAISFAEPRHSHAQTSTPAAPAAPAKPDAAPATAAPGDPFGEETTLTAKPIVYVKGTGNWDTAYQTITGSLKTLKAYIAKENLKADGEPMTIFTSTDDTGFQF
jgi:hypothetical protein